MRFVTVAALASAALASVLPAMASPDAPVIALANAYYGNTWRHQMVEAFEASAKEAKAAGQIADYIVMNGEVPPSTKLPNHDDRQSRRWKSGVTNK